jgi:predicted SAM-dependent methyltransferase
MLITLVRQSELKIINFLNEHQSRNIAIYGAGTAGQEIQKLISEKYQPKYYIDQFASIDVLNQLPVYRIDQLPNDIEIDTVIITVLSKVDYLDIVRKLTHQYHYKLNVLNVRDLVCEQNKFRLKNQISEMYQNGLPIKLVIGSGINLGQENIDLQGWILTDIDSLDICKESDWEFFFSECGIDAILAEHVFEHITGEQMDFVINYCHKYLKDTGYIRLAVPDGFNPDPFYIDLVKPNGLDLGSEDHKILYNYKVLKDKFENNGFETRFLEWFDEAGNFHYELWDIEKGQIKRSKWYTNSWLKSSTSLIFDANKKETSYE